MFSKLYRNEVWRYEHWPGWTKGAQMLVFRGFKWAVLGMVVTVAVDQAFGISKARRGHGHEEHH